MTSIGNSPLQLFQSQLSSAVSSGKIKGADQNALSSALSDIDSVLQTSGLNGAAPSKSTIEGLIAKEVQNGKLTEDQAGELQEIFGSLAGSSEVSSGAAETRFSPSFRDILGSASTGSGSHSNSNDLTATLDRFFESLKDGAVTGYDASGSTSSSLTALLVNIHT